MRKVFKVFFGLVAILALVVVGILTSAAIKFERHAALRYSEVPPTEISAEMTTADLETGRRIVHIRNGCIECHGTDLGGKVFIDGLPGTIAGPNITPAALKSWSDGEIARAISRGVGKDHQPLMIMPSESYQHLSKQDVAAVIAFLRSVPSIERAPVQNRVGFLPKALYLLGKMPNLFPVEMVDLKAPEVVGKPHESVSVEFGKYLVKTSCVGCHGENLAGGPIPGGPPDWPPASDLRASAISGWDEKGFIETMRTGLNPSGKQLRAPMPVEMTKQMNDTELKAMWKFLSAGVGI